MLEHYTSLATPLEAAARVMQRHQVDPARLFAAAGLDAHPYADPDSRQTDVNNLQLPGTAMPHVLASEQGVQNAVWDNVEHKGDDGKPVVTTAFKAFEPGIVGALTPAQFDEFARDTVNFLDYVSDPTQLERQGLGIWVVLFLLMFTGIAYMLKTEYWKDVR